MRLSPKRSRNLAIFLLSLAAMLSPAVSARLATQSQPDAIETLDLRGAAPEQLLSPSQTCALPAAEFPDFVVVDGDGRKAYTATEFVAINVLSLTAMAWPEALALAAIGFALWWFRRTARRKQTTGRPYCRRCNYELTNLTGATCPECGASVSGRGQARGRARWPRLALASVIFATSASLYAANVRTAPRIVWPDHWPAWWSRTLDDVAEANAKYSWLIRHSRVLARVSEVDLETASSRTLWIGPSAESDHVKAMFLSDDGARLTVWHSGMLQSIPLSSGASAFLFENRSKLLPFALNLATHVEVDRDGQFALIIGPAPDYTTALIDLERKSVAWRIERLTEGERENLRVLHRGDLRRFVVAGENPGSGTTELIEWFVDGSDKPARMRRVLTDAYALGPRLARNGFGATIWASNFDQIEGWNLQTERIERRLALPARSVLLTAWPEEAPRLIITMLDQNSTTWVVDTLSGRVLAELSETPLRTRSTQVLADGQTLAVWGYDDDHERKVVLLYDLSALPEAIPEPPQ